MRSLLGDANLKVVDENCLIDIEPPFVVAKIQPYLQHSA
jgi:hypothetical protein